MENIPSSFFSDLSAKQKVINFINYEPISEYPSSTRDFSFLVNDFNLVSEVIDMLDKISDDEIKNSFLFDYYKNDETNIIKLGYRFIFQSRHKTLSDIEINKKVNKILSPILAIEGVSIPGM